MDQLEGDVSSIQGEIQARIQAAQERQEAAEAAAAAEAAEAAEAESAPAPAPAEPAPSGPSQESSSAYIWPIDGTLTSPFGQRWGRLHAGIDIAAPNGTPIQAAASGEVIQAGVSGGYGNYTCIDHGGGVSTCYAHQNSIGVATGQSVSQGDVIGTVGNTGASFGDHLHFEVRMDGTPADPMQYL
ncbi:M23 family metallopeptidase [Thermoleophilia bacterium SCSIO 60948]|nr:M23 family metallopeptidase [Thermoleophilia bacterium SCSIO 60948]